MSATLAEELGALARRVGMLHPEWRDPERLFLARSELVAALRGLARQAGHAPARQPASACASPWQRRARTPTPASPSPPMPVPPGDRPPLLTLAPRPAHADAEDWLRALIDAAGSERAGAQ